MKLPIGKEPRPDLTILLLAGVLTVGIFVLDLQTPLGWTDGFLYVIAPLTPASS